MDGLKAHMDFKGLSGLLVDCEILSFSMPCLAGLSLGRVESLPAGRRVLDG